MKNSCKKMLLSGTCLALLIFVPALASADDGDNKATGSASVNVHSDNNTATSIGASIVNGSQNTAIGTSSVIINGSDNTGTSAGALVVGGNGNTAIGSNAQVIDGNNVQAVGFGAFAGYGNNNTAIGNQAYAGGSGLTQTSGNNVAIGYQATAIGGNSVAIGAYSVANEPNTVSVGQPGYERRITNVAPGIYGTDAVNMDQLRDTQSKLNRLGATAMAMSGLAPMSYNPNQPTQFSAAIGRYSGDTGFAIGVYHYTCQSVMLNAAVGMSSDGISKEVAGRVGVTWWAGPSKKDNKVPDNTIVGTNVPTSEPSSPALAPAKTGASSDNIVDRVNKLLQSSGSDDQ